MTNLQITEEDLQICIGAYQRNKITNEQLLQVFDRLVRSVLSYRNFSNFVSDSMIAEAADLCMEKLDRYCNNKQYKAFNYFVTIISCYLRQAYRIQGNLRKLQEANCAKHTISKTKSI